MLHWSVPVDARGNMTLPGDAAMLPWNVSGNSMILWPGGNEHRHFTRSCTGNPMFVWTTLQVRVLAQCFWKLLRNLQSSASEKSLDEASTIPSPYRIPYRTTRKMNREAMIVVDFFSFLYTWSSSWLMFHRYKLFRFMRMTIEIRNVIIYYIKYEKYTRWINECQWKRGQKRVHLWQ